MRVLRIIIVLRGISLQTVAPAPQTDLCALLSGCRCDHTCAQFGDCCPQCGNTTSGSNETFLFECRSTFLHSSITPGENEAYWMVSACPETWGNGLRETSVEGNCTDGPTNLAPVSDTTTGQIYKNEYCAVCNGAMTIIAWRYQLVCRDSLAVRARQPGFVLTREILERECVPCSFVQPELSPSGSVARACYPHVSSCLEQSVLEAKTGTPFNSVSYNNLVEQCTTSSGPYSLISTDSTGIPFRNQYCAMCNGVNMGLSCYTPPNITAERRTCTFTPAPTTEATMATTSPAPTTEAPIATTSPGPTGPPGLTDQIATTPIGLPGPAGPTVPTAAVEIPPTFTATVVFQSIPFSLVLDIRGNGLVVATSSEITTNITVTCSEGEVFHPPSGECRPTICPEGFTQTGGSCTFVPSPDITLGSGSGASDGNCSGGLRTLDESEYQEAGNNTVLFSGEVVEIVMMDIEGRPVVCVNLTGNVSLDCPAGQRLLFLNDSQLFEALGNNSVLFDGEVVEIAFNDSGALFVCAPQNGTTEINITVTLFSYPVGYFILTYIGCSLSIVGTVIILLTYSLFKDLRTLPSKLLMNLATTILMSSLFILVGGPITAAFSNANLCTSVAVILHFFFLSQFSWMSVMSFEMVRTFNQALKLKTLESDIFKRNLFITYFLIGWGLPLLVAVISITVNFSTNGLVLYGVLSDGTQGRCWINHLESAIVAFVVPVCLSLLFNFTTFIVVSVYLFMASRTQEKLKNRHHISYLRVNLAIFAVSGLTWVFGFAAILAGTTWAWYIFIILNSGLGFVIFIAFLFTKKVLNLYLSLLRIRMPESTGTSTSVKQPLELKKVRKWMHQSNSSSGTSITDTNEQCSYVAMT